MVFVSILIFAISTVHVMTDFFVVEPVKRYLPLTDVDLPTNPDPNKYFGDCVT